MKTNILTSTFSLTAAICVALMVNSTANAADALIKEAPHPIYHVIKAKTLIQATDQIANRSGISFKINAANQMDVINRKLAADNWKSALGQLLQGYNYTTTSANGIVTSVIITGLNGSGLVNTSNVVLVQPHGIDKLPGIYKNLNPGSVMSVNLPLAELNATPVGKKLTLDLPIGQYQINHDDFVKHADGSSTWMGYLENEGKGYRVYLSQGEAGLMGNVYTPDGNYNIETVDGQTLMVDLENSGLQSVGYENDQAQAINLAQSSLNLPILLNQANDTTAAAATSTGTLATSTAISTTCPTGPTVDLMVVYTKAKQTAAYAKQRIKYLVDVTNKAYKDSKINMCLRLVHTRPSTYIEKNSNYQALDDLANDRGAFSGTAAARTKYGADLVMLFRPLYANTSNGCGVTYVITPDGNPGYAKYGYGTISDGNSKDNNYYSYCDASTFAHEIGHSLGNVHERENSKDKNGNLRPGMFSYSYAWGINNKFGTIMSYISPKLMLFSTPKLQTQCKGSPCGYTEGSYRSSDQSRTTNYTAPYIANFKPKKVTTPVIQ